jgi:hypothetical protein
VCAGLNATAWPSRATSRVRSNVSNPIGVRLYTVAGNPRPSTCGMHVHACPLPVLGLVSYRLLLSRSRSQGHCAQRPTSALFAMHIVWQHYIKHSRGTRYVQTVAGLGNMYEGYIRQSPRQQWGMIVDDRLRSIHAWLQVYGCPVLNNILSHRPSARYMACCLRISRCSVASCHSSSILT